MYFPFWFCCFSESKTHFRCVPDGVSGEVFLAGSVTLLQCIHASLAWSCCCFLKHAFRASANTPRVLLLHITRSCFVRAEFSLAGLEPVSANVTLRYSMFGRQSGAGVRLHASFASHPAWRARCLPQKEYVLGLSSFLGCWWY